MMNHGGNGGNYGQHPMTLGQQQLQQQQLNQRMMMQQQQGMRPTGYPGMHPGYQISQKSAQEMTKQWPVEWRQALQQERNSEKKKHLFHNYFCEWERMRMGHGAHPGMMINPAMMGGQQPGMMYGLKGPPGMMPGMMNPAVMQQNKSMHAQNPAVAMQMRMAQAQAASQQQGPPSVQPLSQPPNIMSHPPSVSQMNSIPNTSVPSPSTHLAAAHPPGHSPQILNPATPQNPPSVQSGNPETNPPSQQDPEYIKLLQDLKKMGDPLKKIIERCILDKKPLPKAHDKLLEIIEEKRTVSKDLLARLIKTTQQILDQNSLIYHTIEEFKKVETEKCKTEEEGNEEEKFFTVSEKKIYLNPFSSVSHLFIKVPDEVPRNDEEDLHSASDNALKRRASEESDIPSKIIKTEVEDGKSGIITKKLEVECMFGKGGRKWEMSEAAAQELSEIPWKIDPDSVPPSYKSPDVTVCIDAKILLVPPLRVQIPGSYPDKNPVVQFDRSFPLSVQVSAQLATLFERQLSLSTCRSITTIYESYKTACHELLRIKRSQHPHLVRQKVVV